MKRRRSTSQPRPGHAWAAVATLAATTVLAVACSSTTPGPQVASLGGQHGSGAAQHPLTTAQGDRDMVNFARCMRAHGVALGNCRVRPVWPGWCTGSGMATPCARMQRAKFTMSRSPWAVVSGSCAAPLP